MLPVAHLHDGRGAGRRGCARRCGRNRRRTAAPAAAAVLLAALASSAPLVAAGTSVPIVIDGAFADWRGVPKTSSSDWQIGVAEGPRFLYLHFRLPQAAVVQSPAAAAVLLLDTDGDAATGRPIFGIGADLEWNFGSRSGGVWRDGVRTSIRPAELGLVIAPTVSTRRVEIALAFDARPAGQPLRWGRRLRGAFARPEALLGSASDAARFTYRRGARVVSEPEPLDLERLAPDDLRVMNYNVEFDGLFEPERQGAYRRILRALDPDVVGFQEVFDHAPGQIGALFDAWLPLPGGDHWHVAATGTDVAVASRHPILHSWSVTPGTDAHLIDPRPALPSRVLVLVVSLKCCDDPEGLRKRQIDAILAFWRDAMTEGGEITLAAPTPMVMIGDMNLVGDASEPRALLRGRPFDTGVVAAYDPDWDGSRLTDLRPRLADLPMAYTWRRDDSGGGFAPGRLDYVIFTDSVLRARTRFVLHTPSMPGKRRRAWKLKRKDTTVASDHLPVVADFALR